MAQNKRENGKDDNGIVVVTGMSGAGISSALKALEDQHFEVFDNFPLSLIPELCSQTKGLQDQKGLDGKKGLAIGVDTRTRGFSTDRVLKAVEEIGATLVFVTCDDFVLYKRFTETRRRHPLAEMRTVSYGIEKEQKILAPLKGRADILIDTSDKSIHDLRHVLERYFSLKSENSLTISLVSFGFKHGVPREADIVMDVRFLRNPHWDPNLRDRTGQDEAVGAYVMEDEGFEPFSESFKSLLEPLFARYTQDGKSYLTIAIGCMGGQHRSVFTVEYMKEWMESRGMYVHVDHRDMPQ